MKRIHINLVILVLMSCLSLVGCSTSGDGIGDLYGTWKLKTLRTATDTITFDSIFIGFQGETYRYQANWRSDWGVYERSDNTISFNRMQANGDFSSMGINDKTATFTIDHLGSSSMQLSRNDSVWSFKKYY